MRTNMFTAANGGRPGVPKIGIVITDGRSKSESLTLQEAKAAKDAGITMLALGIGSSRNLDMKEINGIASDPAADHAFIASSFDDLVNVLDKISRGTCAGKTYCYPRQNSLCIKSPFVFLHTKPIKSLKFLDN